MILFIFLLCSFSVVIEGFLKSFIYGFNILNYDFLSIDFHCNFSSDLLKRKVWNQILTDLLNIKNILFLTISDMFMFISLMLPRARN